VDLPQERVLRAKYFDWCSAQVADRFLALSPDEIYALANAASEGGALPQVSSVQELASVEVPGLTFRTMVERVTEILAAQIGLPSFDQWAAAYAESPEHFDAELLGFWREHL
jgi:hypothetical protein